THIVFERIHLRAIAVVAAHLEHIFKSGIGDDAGHDALVLEDGVEAERGAVNEGIERAAIEAETLDRGIDAGRGIARRGKALFELPCAAFDVEHHRVDERAANIDRQPKTHFTLMRRKAASRAAERSWLAAAPELSCARTAR